jgi:hypothetical protein
MSKRGFFNGSVIDRTVCARFLWCGFLPPHGVVGIANALSEVMMVAVWLNVKHASAALRRWSVDMLCHISTVSLCLECEGNRTRSPQPQRALLASMYCAVTSWCSLSIRSGNCCGFHWTDCFGDCSFHCCYLSIVFDLLQTFLCRRWTITCSEYSTRSHCPH